MKIGDQKPIPPSAGGVEGGGQPAEPVREGGFAEKLDETAEASGAGEAASLGDLETLAARIEAGEVSPEDVMRQLVDRVLDTQLGPDAPEALRTKAREFVESTLAEDPHIAALTRRLGGST